MNRLYDAVLGPLRDYGFMRYGLAAAVLIGITSAVVSCLLIVRRQSLLGDAIAHAVLLGVTLGWILAGQDGVVVGALAAGTLTGLAVTVMERTSPLKADAAMGVVFTTAFALGLAIISVTRPTGIDLFHVLLGNILGVAPADLLLTAVGGVLVIGVIVARFADFRIWSFDPTLALTLGIQVRGLHYLFICLVSATVVVSLQAVGLVLVIALLITPGAAAYLLSSRLSRMMVVAAAIGLISAVSGIYASFYLDVAAGPAIVLAASALFFLAYVFAPGHGLVMRLSAAARTAGHTRRPGPARPREHDGRQVLLAPKTAGDDGEDTS